MYFASLLAPAAALVATRSALPAAPARLAARSSPEMKYRVAVIGGGPSGACAAEICAQEPNIETSESPAPKTKRERDVFRLD